MRKKIFSFGMAAIVSGACVLALAGCADSADTSQTTQTTSETHVSESAETTTTSTEASAAAGSEQESTAQEESTDAQTAESEASSSADALSPIENGKVSSETLEIELKGYKVVPAGVGGAQNSLNPVVVFYYDATNLSDKDIDANSAWTEIFDAYQNTGENDRNMLGTGIFSDDTIPAEEGTALIKKGETKSYYKPYELTDNTTSVTLKSHNGLGGAALGEDIIIRVMS